MNKLVQEIMELKKKRNAVILAHIYQPAEIQELADFCGDSLELSRKAAKTDADVIVFCGVHFMAETANILSPEKIVLLPDIHAGCRMADMVSAEDLAKHRAEKPDAVVVSYVNTTASVKALSDVCCTSSNAVKVVASIPKDKEIIFVPDKNLGRYAAQNNKRELDLWQGFCPVHQNLQAIDVKSLKNEYPKALVLAHPECNEEVIELADYVGSTSGILNYAAESPAKEFIIATECGVMHRLELDNPNKKFYMADNKMICPNMKYTTLEKVKACLEKLEPRVVVPKEIRDKAVASLTKMLDICR